MSDGVGGDGVGESIRRCRCRKGTIETGEEASGRSGNMAVVEGGERVALREFDAEEDIGAGWRETRWRKNGVLCPVREPGVRD